VHTNYISLGRRLIAKQSGGTSIWPYSDYQVSVLFGVDNIGHPIIGMGYEPYGSQVKSGTADGRGFIGQRRDEANLLYLHARFYESDRPIPFARPCAARSSPRRMIDMPTPGTTRGTAPTSTDSDSGSMPVPG
jgi:hypothetical protein